MKRPTIEGMPSPTARTGVNQDSAPAPAFDLDVKRSVQRHPKLAASVAVVVLGLVVAFGLTRVKSYQAESLTYIEPMASKVLSQTVTQDGYDPVRYDTYIQQQMQTALRPDILATAIRKLPPFVWQRPGETMQSAVARLQSSLKVERVSTSYQLSISLSDANPETAASVVNAVTNTYLEQGRKDEHAAIDQRLKLLEEERQRIQQNLNEDRVEQASLGSALGVANPTGLVGNQYDAQIAGVQSQIATARAARDAAAAQLGALQGTGATSSPALAAAAEEIILNDPGLSNLKGTISQRKAALNTQMAGMLPANTIYQQDQKEIADLDRTLENATNQLREKTERRLQDKMRADLQRTADIENRLNEELKRQTATATSAAPKLQRATELAGDVDRLSARYGVVDDAMRGLELESNGPGSAHLSVAAVVPVGPEPSKRKLILLLALPLALLAGAGAAVLAHRVDRHIYSPPDVEKVLGFLPIGVMPARDEVSERVMEEYTLRLAAGLQNAYRTSSAQSFVFTAASSTVEIGKFVRAMERVLGTMGFKALALDAASVLNPGIRTPSTQRGMTMHRSSALVRTIDGVRQGIAAEEIERLKLKYDLVLIDASPLLSSAETEYLVRCTDATILIAESGVTLKSELYQSAVLLQQLNVAGVGAVLQELHLKDAYPAFRTAIAAVERMQRGQHESAKQIAGGVKEVEEIAADEEAADEVAERLRQMSVPTTRPGTKVDVSPAVRAAGMAPAVAEDTEAAAETAEKPVAHGPVAIGPERIARSAAKHESERAMLAGGMGQESDQVHIEERDQVRPWRELLKRRKENAAGTVISESMDEKIDAEQASREPEPILYFEDRMRPRKAEQAVSASEAEKEERRAEAIRAEPAKVVPVAAAWEVESAVAHAHEPVVSEPVQSLPLAEDITASPSKAAAPVYVDRSSSYYGTDARREEPAGEDYAPETEPIAEAVFETGEVEVSLLETNLNVEAARWEEFEEQSKPEEGVAVAEVQEGAVFQTPSEFAAGVDVPGMQQRVADVEGGEMPVAENLARAERWNPETPNLVAAEEHVAQNTVAAAIPAAEPPRRAPVAPKLEWFTLKFRGTSERVLRLVPGEELPESVEASHTALREPLYAASAEEEAQRRGDSDPGKRLDEDSVEEITAEDRAISPGAEQKIAESEANETEPELPLPETVVLATEETVEVSGTEVEDVAKLRQAKNWADVEDADAEDLEDHVVEAELESKAEANNFPEPQAVIQEETAFVAADPGMKGHDERSGEPYPAFEPEIATKAVEVPVESEVAGPVLGAAVLEASVTDEASIAVEPAPAPRAKINRWAVEDHVPEESAWKPASGREHAVLASAGDDNKEPPLIASESLEEAWRPAAGARGDEAIESIARLSPVKLMDEFRSRSPATTQFERPQMPARSWSRRSAAAPVEERLEPRAVGLTRRWEMLSRFDSSPQRGEANEEPEVPAAAKQEGL